MYSLSFYYFCWAAACYCCCSISKSSRSLCLSICMSTHIRSCDCVCICTQWCPRKYTPSIPHISVYIVVHIIYVKCLLILIRKSSFYIFILNGIVQATLLSRLFQTKRKMNTTYEPNYLPWFYFNGLCAVVTAAAAAAAFSFQFYICHRLGTMASEHKIVHIEKMSG